MKPSLVKTYVERFSSDPAFTPPPEPDSPDREAYDIALRTAHETGDFTALVIDGQTPVAYNVRPLRADELAVLFDMKSDGAGGNELCALAFRTALQSIGGLDVKVKFSDHDRMGRISTLAWLEEAKIPPLKGLAILSEIGDRIINRAMNLDPLS